LTEIYKHQKAMFGLFDLLGENEDDMTAAFGWVMSQVPFVQEEVFGLIGLPDLFPASSVELQKSTTGEGRTDIEVIKEGAAAVVIEAKKGLSLPKISQMKLYAKRLLALDVPLEQKRLIVLSDCEPAIARVLSKLPDRLSGIPLIFITWGEIGRACEKVLSGARGEKRWILKEFTRYIGLHIMHRDPRSNIVRLVPLSTDVFGDTRMSFLEIVQTKNIYFHPIDGRYPKTPPNYFGFRHDKKLVSVHFVESFEIVTDFAPYFSGTSETDLEPHFLFHLGPAIIPPESLEFGRINYQGRQNVMLDTLFTERTIALAVQKTNFRLSEIDR
tara:strand:+ start:895 stop:1878 length:984 start_codon:yes stop_codon:yes gene_type:complete